MKVKDVMSRDVVAVRPETPLKEAARLMTTHGISGGHAFRLVACDPCEPEETRVAAVQGKAVVEREEHQHRRRALCRTGPLRGTRAARTAPATARRDRRHRRCPGPRPVGRFGDDGSHLAGRGDRAGERRGALARRAWRASGPVQQLWLTARNHEVMVRGTFANVRLRNLLAPGAVGPVTIHRPSGQRMEIFEAAQRYEREVVPLIVVAGREYGSGSSRDWAAKGPRLLGVRVVLAQSFERIHRSNLVGVGILPLRFDSGEGPDALGLTGAERYSILGIERALVSDRRVLVVAEDDEGSRQFAATVLLEGPSELDSYRAGGILPALLAGLVAAERPASPIQPAGPGSASRSSGRSTSGLAPSTSR